MYSREKSENEVKKTPEHFGNLQNVSGVIFYKRLLTKVVSNYP